MSLPRPPIEVKPLNTQNGMLLGGDVTGVSIQEILASKDLRRQIRELLTAQGLLLFRNSRLSPAEETEFMQIFDWDDESPFADVTGPYHTDGIGLVDGTAAQWKIPTAPAVQLQGSGRIKDHHGLSGILVSHYATREWHVDGAHDVMVVVPAVSSNNNESKHHHDDRQPSSLLCPPVATSMYCLQTPKVGGETLFASGTAAFQNLSSSLQQQALALDACYDRFFRPMQKDGCQAQAVPCDDSDHSYDALPPPQCGPPVMVTTNRHPIVIRDPLGRPSLYVGPAFTQCLVDRASGKTWTQEESQDLIGECLRQGLRNGNMYQHRWDPLDFVVWSNRCMLHSATETDAYRGQDRLFHRIRMASKVPVEAFDQRHTDDDTDYGEMQRLYGRLWALQQLLASGFIQFLLDVSVTNRAKFSHVGFAMTGATRLSSLITVLLWMAYAAVLYRPQNKTILTTVHVINMVVHTVKIPFLWDYEVWDWLMELTVVTMGVQHGASLVRWQLAIFYYATTVYKFTRSFFSHKVSCAPIFVLALLDMMVPAGLSVPQPLIAMLTVTAPALTILVEGLIPTLLAVAPGWGVLVGLLFHFLITIQPPPGNAGGFSVSLAVQYAFFCRFGKSAPMPTLIWYAAVPFLAAMTALGHSHGDDWAVPVHAIMILALVPAALETGGRPFVATTTQTKVKRSLLVTVISALTLIYAFGMPIMGGDMGASTMFSNLRVYSKSNHLFLPTGLLLNTTSVRVDFTTSDHINSVHPNEASGLYSPRLKAWLQSGGHSGRQFAPYLKRSLNITITSNGETEFVPYIIPDLEVRRLVQEAFDVGEDSFTLEYTKLPSLDRVVFKAWDRSCFLMSALSKSSQKKPIPCSKDESVLNPGLSFWQSKLLLFFSFPVSHNTSEDVGISELGCMC
jgi:alpha-ketoglutarate-dependent taurine dioxygenase